MYQIPYFKIKLFLWISIFLVACQQEIKQEKKPLPYYNSPNFTPLFLSNQTEIKSKVPHIIANFSFLDQHHQTITQKDIEGKIHVANFIFTSCGSICPIMTANLKMLQDTFRNDKNVVLLSYSVTPWIDNVKRLNDYANLNQINAKNWHLLTGSKAEIYQLARRSYFAEEDLGFTKDSTEFLHTEHVLLIDQNKRIRGIYNGTLQLEIAQLAKDIKVLKNEH